jgi:hypothetical protein
MLNQDTFMAMLARQQQTDYAHNEMKRIQERLQS